MFRDGGEFTGDWRDNLRGESENPRAVAPWFIAYANGADKNKGECGADYLFDAFYFARKYDPAAILYCNEYNEEFPVKREAIAGMVEEINGWWSRHPEYDGRLLIEAMGMQAHYSNALNFNLLSAAMDRYLATGVNISLTELDVELFGGNTNRNRVPTATEFERQSYVFARVISYAMERHEHVNRVTFWGLTDNNSIHWLYGRYANMFYENRQPKQAFWSIVALVDESLVPLYCNDDMEEEDL
jgi:GH35 family endo-1,4-beta-xylanase